MKKRISMKEFLQTHTREIHKTEGAVSLQRLAMESFCRLMIKRKFRAIYDIDISRAVADGDLSIVTGRIEDSHRSRMYQRCLLEAQNCLHIINTLQTRLEIRKQELLSMVEEN